MRPDDRNEQRDDEHDPHRAARQRILHAVAEEKRRMHRAAFGWFHRNAVELFRTYPTLGSFAWRQSFSYTEWRPYSVELHAINDRPFHFTIHGENWEERRVETGESLQAMARFSFAADDSPELVRTDDRLRTRHDAVGAILFDVQELLTTALETFGPHTLRDLFGNDVLVRTRRVSSAGDRSAVEAEITAERTEC